MSLFFPDDRTAALNRWVVGTSIAVVFASCTTAAPTSVAPTSVAPSKTSPCAVKTDCAGGACDPASHTCTDCLQDTDCSSPGQVCLDGQCKAGKTCTSSVACKATAQVCNTGAGHCVDCIAEADCAAGKTCLANKCIAKTVCSSDVQCATVCAVDLGFCVTCNKSADCAAGHWCGADHACHASMCDAGACLGTAGPSAVWLACNADGSGYASPKTCDDKKACTVDTCVPASGCANAQTPGIDCSEPATCTFDGSIDGQETDVDCGGAICPHCAAGAKCTVALDCLTQSCVKDVCSGDPGCVDGKTSGNETDTDCGGTDCKPCADNKKCIGGSDCASLVCVNKACAPASCTDQVKNGQETDKDCGGANCPACVSGKTCSAASDCASAICKNGACQAESCTDKTLNGTETDIDCGGTTCPKCALGQACKLAINCVASSNPCAIPACPAGTCTQQSLAPGATCGSGKACDASGACVKPVSTVGMVLIPAGTFWMGCNATKDGNCNSDENPQHKVTLSAYYVDLTETTVTQYKACVDAGVCTVPSSVQPAGLATYPGLTNNPVNYVSWMQSQQYCQWRGAGFDLPTEAQWEMAARGSCEKNGSTGGDPGCSAAMRTYPWGEATASCGYAVMFDGTPGCTASGTAPVDSKPAGDSPYGLHDMAGNVWEWNRDWYSSGYYGSSPGTDPLDISSESMRGCRGGAYNVDVVHLRAGGRFANSPKNFVTFPYQGLRCVKSYP